MQRIKNVFLGIGVLAFWVAVSIVSSTHLQAQQNTQNPPTWKSYCNTFDSFNFVRNESRFLGREDLGDFYSSDGKLDDVKLTKLTASPTALFKFFGDSLILSAYVPLYVACGIETTDWSNDANNNNKKNDLLTDALVVLHRLPDIYAEMIKDFSSNTDERYKKLAETLQKTFSALLQNIPANFDYAEKLKLNAVPEFIAVSLIFSHPFDSLDFSNLSETDQSIYTLVYPMVEKIDTDLKFTMQAHPSSLSVDDQRWVTSDILPASDDVLRNFLLGL